jgi:dihydrolipoamide dehydrogenase
MKTDVLVIGGGPGGYVAAIRAAQLGKKVILAERDRPGGICVTVGCIPSKALIGASKLVDRIRDAAELGIDVDAVRVDLARMQVWKEGVVKKLVSGVQFLLKGNGVEQRTAEARFLSPGAARVGDETVEFDACVIATGSRPMAIPGFSFDGEAVIDSSGALALTELPGRLCVIGGGYIGLEIGTLYARLGSQVTIVEMLDQILPGTDPDLVGPVLRKLKKRGVAVHAQSRALSFEGRAGGIRVRVQTHEGETAVECDRILVAVGRQPQSDGVDLEKAGVARDARGFIPVDEKRRTNVPHIYAIGDVAGQPMLAHKASREGEVAAEVIAGRPSVFEPKCMPAVVFGDPEIAYAGMQEPEGRAAGREIVIGKFPFSALGRALAAAEPDGFVKIVGDARTHAALGVQIVGAGAGDLIGEAALALEMGALVPDIGLTIHPHPTLPEAVMEAAKAALGEAIHALNRR